MVCQLIPALCKSRGPPSPSGCQDPSVSSDLLMLGVPSGSALSRRALVHLPDRTSTAKESTMTIDAKLSIGELAAQVSGRVIAPGDAEYDDARTVMYGGFDRRPAVIVRAADARDVAAVIALARQTGLELAVRSGGHSGAGHSTTDGGIVLDLRDLKGLEIDVA